MFYVPLQPQGTISVLHNVQVVVKQQYQDDKEQIEYIILHR